MTHNISSKTNIGRQVNWKISFTDKPTDDMISFIIEDEFPAEGYGVSYVSKPVKLEEYWVVFVSSNASCD